MKCPVAACLSNRTFLLTAIVVVPLAVLSGVAMRSASDPAAAGPPPCAAARQSCLEFHASERPGAGDCSTADRTGQARPEACTGAAPVAP